MAQIWRKAPENKEQTNIIYKINHQSNFVDENLIKSSGSYQNFEGRFPFLPRQCVSYFNINDLSQEDMDNLIKSGLSLVSEELEPIIKKLM